MSIEIISLSLPNSVKKEFIKWADSLDLSINPYSLKYYHYNSSNKNILAKKAGAKLKELFPEIKIIAKRFLKVEKEPKILVLKNLPLDNNLEEIHSPVKGEVSTEKGYISELIILAISYNLNAYIKVYPKDPKPFNLPFHQVVPHKGKEKKVAVNYGAGDFPFHNDRNHKDFIDFLLLYGLRSPSKVPTYFLAIESLISNMPEELYLALFRKEFTTLKSEKKISLLQGNPKKPNYISSTLDLAKGWINPTSEDGKSALAWVRKKSGTKKTLEKAKKISITPGTMVVFDHLRIVHGRKAFSPYSQNFRRWLQRSYLCRNKD